MSLTSKWVLGAMQLELDYGIVCQSGRIPESDTSQILIKCCTNNTVKRLKVYHKLRNSNPNAFLAKGSTF